MRKTILIALKGMLLYLTVLAIIIFITVIDSLNKTDIGLGIVDIGILLYGCYTLISKEDLKILIGAKLYKEFEDEL